MRNDAATSDPLSSQLSPDLSLDLAAFFKDLDAEVERAGAACQLSGRCCRFAEYGHTLFLSAIEADWLLEQAPPPARPLDHGQTCPWQSDRGLCTARGARPLGCRVYYCDPGWMTPAAELSERFIARLKELTVRYNRVWNYAPLHDHLERGRARGRLVIDLANTDEA
jgi:Fe-S-cluster containining protein